MGIGLNPLRLKEGGNVEMRLIRWMPMLNPDRAGAPRTAAETHAIVTCRAGDMRDAGLNVVTRRTECIDRTG